VNISRKRGTEHRIPLWSLVEKLLLCLGAPLLIVFLGAHTSGALGSRFALWSLATAQASTFQNDSLPPSQAGDSAVVDFSLWAEKQIQQSKFMGRVSWGQSGRSGVITGAVTYLQRSALPPDAELSVQLQDASLEDVPARLIAQVKIATEGKQVPIPFRIPYAVADIDSAHSYIVRATIEAGGSMIFSSTTSYAVITRGAPTEIEILVRPVSAAETSTAPEDAGTGKFTTPVTFAGDLPCADCAGIRFNLTLRPDGTFLSRAEYVGKGKPFYDLGRWSMENEDTRLVLRSGQEAPRQFARTDANTLRQLDLEGREITSKLNYDLKRAATVGLITDTFRITGEFVYMADSGLLTECLTGLRWPVAPEKENAILERAYSASGAGAGKSVLITFDGHFATRPKMEGAGDQEVLVVDQFTQLGLPDQRCPSRTTATQLEGTDWNLIQLDGAPVVAGPGAKRANLVLSEDGKKLAGSGGCNQMFGTYELEKDVLRFKPMGMTMMACLDPVMKQEQALVEALKATSSYRIVDEVLELRDGDRVLARLDSKAR